MQIPEALVELGLKYYQEGNYTQALIELNKAILANPEYELPKIYIQKIEKELSIIPKEKRPPTQIVPEISNKTQIVQPVLPKVKPAVPQNRMDIVQSALDKASGIPVIPSPRVISPVPSTSTIPAQEPLPEIELQKVQKKAVLENEPVRILVLDENFKNLRLPIEVAESESIIIQGQAITRFLATEPDIIRVVRLNPDEIMVTGNTVGHTYLHIWDSRGRWTTEFLGVPPRPEGPTVEEEMRMAEEKAGTFKFMYSLDWSSYEAGSRLGTLRRQNYGWTHNLALYGESPYGYIDTSTIIRTNPGTTDITYYTLGLTNGRWGDFKDFSMRAFDFTPSFSNLALGSTSLRGFNFESPAFNKRIDYSVFWGREGGGRYGNLSPGLNRLKNSYINGVDFNVYPLEEMKDLNLGFSVLHGYGADRDSSLNPYAYDGRVNWRLGKWAMGYENAYDSEHTAQLFRGNLNQRQYAFTYEFRDIAKDYMSIMGQGWRRGELGGLFTFNYSPTDRWSIYNSLDIYRDRLFPALDNDKRWNEDYTFNTSYRVDPKTSLRLDYTLQNDLGRLSQVRYQSAGTGISRRFDFIRQISTYANYRHSETKNFTNPSSDNINDGIYAGLRFSLIGDLYYFLNKQWNWIDERFYGDIAKTEALETGFDINNRIFNSRFYENIRLTYRDEETGASRLGFLSGEDYAEGYGELTYRASDDKEVYCSTRIRHVWPNEKSLPRRVEADFNAGLRYVWDTGVRWETKGNIEGYVFRDLNSDGLRQREEAPVEGVTIWLGKNRSVVTDIFGYFKFTGIKGKKRM
ncbi:MAG: pilus assembly protein N-terminal domain-containing protein [Candidatus Omnitrophica bacterium]|nr:pilus assembly protein N-terminal domain-containing protein [Candidatus Omnitrophota bacterium]